MGGRFHRNTHFVERCRTFTVPGGYYALVNPENWLSSPTDETFRKRLLTEQTLLCVVCLGPKAFDTIGGCVVQVVLMGVANRSPERESVLAVLDASDYLAATEKSRVLAKHEMSYLDRQTQLRNPASRIVIGELKDGPPLGDYVKSGEGSSTGDNPRYVRKFWELPTLSHQWATYAGADPASRSWGGREHILFWEDGCGELGHSKQARIQNRHLWSRTGVLVGKIGRPSVTLYTGGLFDKSCVAICPVNESLLPAIWLFCTSPEYELMLKMLDRNLATATSALTGVPFDVKLWQAKADRAGPIPEPHSEDPTQWLFKGNVPGSDSPLHVATCRLLGYKWPEQPEEDELSQFAASDGVVCVSPVLGQRAAVDRLRDLLTAAYGAEWNMAFEDVLLEQVGYREKGLESWLRDGFFSQHSRLFHNRPFIWHIWDGLNDGFSVLLNYHMLDRPKLEKLIYSYLGDWISRQKEAIDADTPGAEQRLRAAEALRSRLELILVGEAPYDIYVRWKSISEQPIGWNPDLDDGVRLNIRPFVKADVLRSKVRVRWGKDQGRDPDGSERINDRHLTFEEKEKVRKAQ